MWRAAAAAVARARRGLPRAQSRRTALSAVEPEAYTPAVAVVSDGSAYPTAPHARILHNAVAADAAPVQRLGRIDAEPFVLPEEGELLASLAQLPARFGAFFLVRTEVRRAEAVSGAVAAQDLRPVLTEQDAPAAGVRPGDRRGGPGVATLGPAERGPGRCRRRRRAIDPRLRPSRRR